MKLFVVLLLCGSILPDLTRTVVVISGPMHGTSIYYGNFDDLRRLEREAFKGRPARQTVDTKPAMKLAGDALQTTADAAVETVKSTEDTVADMSADTLQAAVDAAPFQRRRRARQK